MDSDNLIEFSEGLVSFYGENLANPDQEPRRFRWQVKCYKYIMGQKPQPVSQKE